MQKRELYSWLSIPCQQLESHPARRTPFRLVADSAQMGREMAAALVEEIVAARRENRQCRAIVPCGPKSWYAPFCEMINAQGIPLDHLLVFHMDECLDWQGRLLPRNDPYNFRTFMEQYFYDPVRADLQVLRENRLFLEPATMARVAEEIQKAPVDIALGGIGQDGHLAYNQARRDPYSQLTLEELKNSTIRIQMNNWDTVMALAHRTFGAAYQFVPPMSVTLGVKEILGAKKVRVYTDTGAWKQTALRVALFSPPTVEYPATLLQEHPDALITATVDTARHPISENPDWEFPGIEG